MDEPAVGLSANRLSELDALLRRIRDQKGVTLILIEHVIRLVMGVCDQVTVLSSGRRIADGQPQAVRDDRAVIEAYLGKELVLDIKHLRVAYGIDRGAARRHLPRARAIDRGAARRQRLWQDDASQHSDRACAPAGRLGAARRRRMRRHGRPTGSCSVGLAQVPQGREVWPSMTVLDNLELGAVTRRDWSAIKADVG